MFGSFFFLRNVREQGFNFSNTLKKIAYKCTKIILKYNNNTKTITNNKSTITQVYFHTCHGH